MSLNSSHFANVLVVGRNFVASWEYCCLSTNMLSMPVLSFLCKSGCLVVATVPGPLAVVCSKKHVFDQ